MDDCKSQVDIFKIDRNKVVGKINDDLSLIDLFNNIEKRYLEKNMEINCNDMLVEVTFCSFFECNIFDLFKLVDTLKKRSLEIIFDKERELLVESFKLLTETVDDYDEIIMFKLLLLEGYKKRNKYYLDTYPEYFHDSHDVFMKHIFSKLNLLEEEIKNEKKSNEK